MNDINVLGVDPGVAGAIAVLNNDKCVLCLRALPASADGLARLLRVVKCNWPINLVAVEMQTPRPRQGRTSLGKQMQGYGIVLGVCAGLGLFVRPIAPVVWKRRVGLMRSAGIGAASMAASAASMAPSAASMAERGSLNANEWMSRNARKALSLPHARALCGFSDAIPAKATQIQRVGMADAALIAWTALVMNYHKP